MRSSTVSMKEDYTVKQTNKKKPTLICLRDSNVVKEETIKPGKSCTIVMENYKRVKRAHQESYVVEDIHLTAYRSHIYSAERHLEVH